MGGTESGATESGATAPPPPEPAPPAQSPPPPTPAPSAPASSSVLSSLSQPELMIAGGALLIVLVDLIFNIVFDWYFIDPVTWLLAAMALLVVGITRFMGKSLPFDYTTALIVIGALLALITIRTIVWDILYLGQRTSRISVEFLLPALLLYVGAALVAYGALLLWRGRTA